MYLSELKLWNFRKYGVGGKNPDSSDPGLSLQLEPGLNVLIGENDSGRTAIVYAIRYDWALRILDKDQRIVRWYERAVAKVGGET